MNEKIEQIINNMYGKKVFFFLPLGLVVILFLVWLSSFFLGGNYPTGGVGMMYNESVSQKDSYDMVGFGGNEMGYGAPTGGMMPTNSRGGVVVNKNIERKIVRDASLDVLVKKVEDTAKNIQEIANRFDGVITNSNVSSRGIDTKYGTIVIRVPNDKFNSAIEEIKKLAVKVNSEKISSDDVTAQFVDLEARLRSKKAVEEQYVSLLQKANKVEEIIAVSSYLNVVREEIEVLQAQINYLSNQVAMSSITISMTSETEVKVLGITWYPITVIKQSFRSLLLDLTGIVDWLISFVFSLPGLLIKLGIFVGLLWIAIRAVKSIYKRLVKNNLPTQAS